MVYNVHYGHDVISLNIPQRNIETVLSPWKQAGARDLKQIWQETEHQPAVAQFRRVIKGKRLCVLVPDGTREWLFEDCLAGLFHICEQCRHIRVLICTGTHSPFTEGNQRLQDMISALAVETARPPTVIKCHDCRKGPFISAGTTSRGTPIMVNADIQEADVFLVLSDVKVHYFAGYSNPIKNFVPGVCAYETAEKNHRWALDDQAVFGHHPWHPDAARRNNPVAQDQREGMEYIVKDRPVYALVTISSEGKINWAQFGPVREVTAGAFVMADKNNMHRVSPTDRLIVSAGGHPSDVDLYIAQRALELTKAAVRDNGEILLLAACPGGAGERHTWAQFYERLTAPIDDILKSIEQEYVLYSHKPYRLAQMIKRLRRIWLVSDMEEALVRTMHLFPASDPQGIIDRWLTEDPGVRITVVDGANKVALLGDCPDRGITYK